MGSSFKLVLLVCGLNIIPALHARAQADVGKNPRSLGMRIHYGFIIPHSESIREISHSMPRGFQVDYARHLNTQEVWDRAGCYPRIGLSFSYFDYDNPSILGHSYTLSGFVEPFITFRSRLNPLIRMGAGISYLDKVFHPEHNPDNLFFSHPLSFYLLLNAGLNYRFNDLFSIILTGNYSHISNGRMRLPNKGMNFPTLSMGVDYKIDPVNLPDRSRNLTKKDIHGNLFRMNIAAYASRKEAHDYGKKYQVYGFELTGSYVASRISGIGLGIEVTHDRSLQVKESLRDDGPAHYHPTTLAGLATHELFMGSFIFDQALGAYVNKPSPSSPRFYQKIGLRYRMNPFFNFGVVLKTHTQTADFVSLKIGCIL